MKVEKETPAQLRRRRELGEYIQSFVERNTFQAILDVARFRILEEWEIEFLEESGLVGELATRCRLERDAWLAASPGPPPSA